MAKQPENDLAMVSPQNPHTIISLEELASTSHPQQIHLESSSSSSPISTLAVPSCPDTLPEPEPPRPYPVLSTTAAAATDSLSSSSSYPVFDSHNHNITNHNNSNQNDIDTNSSDTGEETIDIIEPLSNPITLTTSSSPSVKPQDPTKPITLFCIVDGTSTSQCFSIKPRGDDTVYDMKVAIKLAQSPNFDHVPASELSLRKIRLQLPQDDDDTLTTATATAAATSSSKEEAVNRLIIKSEKLNWRELKPMDRVQDVYASGTESNTIQVLVMKTRLGPNYSDAGVLAGVFANQ
ncbi:hypothetical protein BG004_004244 [Podila humilis]|nr:hypothetical protein BG004_004244 [Podila humilis]